MHFYYVLLVYFNAHKFLYFIVESMKEFLDLYEPIREDPILCRRTFFYLQFFRNHSYEKN